MPNQTQTFSRVRPVPVAVPAFDATMKKLPERPNTLFICLGTSATEVGLYCQCIAAQEGSRLAIASIDNDTNVPAPVKVRGQDGTLLTVSVETPFIMGAGQDEPDIEEAMAHPVLKKRYEMLLRGIPLQDLKAGRGGRSFSAVSALHYDVYYAKWRSYLYDKLRMLQLRSPRSTEIQDSAARIRDVLEARRAIANAEPPTINVIAGAAGSTGNAGAQITPYPIRDMLRHSLGIHNFNLRLFLIGPNALGNLTRNGTHNVVSLYDSLSHMNVHGFYRQYVKNSDIDTLEFHGTAPYDRVFIIDDATLEQKDNKPTTEALTKFKAHAATLIMMFDNSTANKEFESYAAANQTPDGRMPGSEGRWLCGLRGSLLGVDSASVHEMMKHSMQSILLSEVESCLSS